jgi:anti-anti-sigma factor
MRPPTMRDEDGVLIVRFDDPTVLNELPSLWTREAIYRELQAHAFPRVLIDLGPIDYLSSLGIGALVGLKKRVEAYGGQLVLVGVQIYVREILQGMGLLAILPIADDAQSALALLSPPPSV